MSMYDDLTEMGERPTVEDQAWAEWPTLNVGRGATVTDYPPPLKSHLDAKPKADWRELRYIKKAEPKPEPKVSPLPESALAIAKECDRIKAFLVEKNLKYGNSALDPMRLFSSAGTVEQLLVRIDDKLSRLQRGGEYPGDDTTLDLIGYLILLRIAIAREEAK